jgi:hypothetical protein
MASSYSTNLALTLPVQGELSGTWGTTVNTGITNMVDEALGYQAYSATGGSDTLTIPDGSTGVARSIYIQLNGTGGGTVNVPTTKTKMYFVFNNTSSAITFKVTGQTGVSIPAAAKMALVSNGTDIIVAQNYFAALTLGAALPVASGGTGITSFGSGVATFLGTPSSSNLAAAVTDETGSGALVFATSPTLVTPALGTPSQGVLSSCTVDGTNAVGYKAIPQSGAAKTTSYTLAVGDVGEFIEVGASGAIVVPNATFATGDAVVIFNNTTGAITLTMSITTAYIGGTDADKATISLATRGICNVLFISGTVCVVTGNVT